MQRAVASVVLAVSPALLHAQTAPWAPPTGIPAPSFGVAEVAGATTVTVPPGGSIPNPIPAGTVVELAAGTHARNYEGGSRLHCDGTAAAPAFVRGAPGAIVTGTLEVQGSYCIFERLTVRMERQQSRTTLILGNGGGDHLVLRDSDVSGNLAGGGVGVVSYFGGSIADIVFLRNRIHDNGDVNATSDQDVHGLALHQGERIWVIDNELSGNSGDGVQVNGSLAGLHHVYLGRNVAHHNKQTGLWTKEASDVVFSENTAYGHRPSGSSPGAGLGGQYGPARVWFLYNRVYDNTTGIRMASDSDPRVTDHYYVGNVISGIVGPAADDGWGNSGIDVWGGTNVTIVGNTMVDVPNGISCPRNKRWTIEQNVIQSRGAQIAIGGALMAGSTRRADLYAPPVGAIGAPPCTHCLAGAPQLGPDLAPLPGSPAIDAGGAESAVYATFQQLYGLDIRRGRPTGAWDIGAIEAPRP
jgi:hypothetical protein